MKKEVARREIESLDYYLQNHTDDYSEESHTAMMMAISALSENKGEWIPVTERIPENSDSVLATTRWGELTIAEKLDIGPDCWFIYEGNANAHTEDIVAWQPLPEPYRKGGE